MNATHTQRVERPETADTQRRGLLTGPGEPLLVSLSPFESALRFEQFARVTGVPRASLSTSMLCSIPLPVYPARFDGPRRWSGVRPEAMWHPLLWLPPRLAQRYRTGADPVVLESDDLWSVRVALEMAASGLYDQARGEWVDILALFGIDIDDQNGAARVGNWLDGASDPDLDCLGHQVADMLDLAETDEDWAAVTAAASLDSLRIASWAFAADSLSEVCAGLCGSNAGDEEGRVAPWAAEEHSGESLPAMLQVVADMAAMSFAIPPESRPDDVSEAEFWEGAGAEAGRLIPGNKRDAVALASRMRNRLDGLRAVYWPLIDEER